MLAAYCFVRLRSNDAGTAVVTSSFGGRRSRQRFCGRNYSDQAGESEPWPAVAVKACSDVNCSSILSALDVVHRYIPNRFRKSSVFATLSSAPLP